MIRSLRSLIRVLAPSCTSPYDLPVTGRIRSPYAPKVSCRTAAVVLVVAGLVGLVSVGACSADSDEPASDPLPAAEAAWREVTLPVPAGPSGRIAVRDAAHCGGSWYVVGAVIGTDGSSRPAAWTSSDGRGWRAIPTAPVQFWAGQAVLSTVACRDGRIAAIGAKPGGAHGNPRTITWRQRADGTLVDVQAPFELYGGPSAVSVNRIAAGPDGWMIAGTRRSGAAVWVSPDSTDFRLVDDDPELSSDGEHRTTALDAVHDGTAWTVTGRVQMTGRVAPAPMSWSSADGSAWQREHVPAGTHGYADLQRVTQVGNRVVAAGVRGDTFGVWERRSGRWRAADEFGSIAGDSTRAPYVSGLAAANGSTLVSVNDTARFQLWAADGDGWREVGTPTRPAVTGDTQLTVAGAGTTVLLLADDGTSGRAWIADWNILGQ